MTRGEFEQIRDKDHVVLKHIKEGHNDVQKITAQTTLENHHVTYCFEKLEEQGLITVEKPDKMVERVVNGQKRVFQHPKEAELTEKGLQYLVASERRDSDKYQNLSHREVTERIHNLENQVEELEKAFEVFKNQVIQKLE
jgi:predicted transcriptional regulator